MEKSAALEKTIQFLRVQIDVCKKGSTAQLPTVLELSAACGVAPATVWKAIARLKEEGVLDASRGRRITIRDGRPAAAPVPLAAPDASGRRGAWTILAESLEQDILNGKFRPGAPLPLGKELTNRYGVCSRTLKKALDHLVDRKVLTVYKKRFTVPRRHCGAPNSRILLISRGDNGRLHIITPRTQDHLRTLESECSQSGIGLDVTSQDIAFDALRYPAKAAELFGDSKDSADYLGYMVWDVGTGGYQEFPLLISRLQATGKPVTVLLETADTFSRQRLSVNRSTRYYTIASSPAAGTHLARYLLSLGHRSIAYFTTDELISAEHQGRGWGMLSSFTAAGHKTGMHIFRARSPETPVSSEDYIDRVQQIVDTVLDRGSVSVSRKAPESFDRSIFGLELQLARILEGKDLHERLVPVFEQALEDRSISAWVGWNDAVAIECLNFLGDRGIRVPQQISVAGFDDGVSACLHELTSYNFNGVSAVRAMINFIIDRRSNRPGAADPRPVEIEGYVTARKSTGRTRVTQ